MDVGQFLRKHGIEAPRHEHPAVMTVEESLRLVPRLPGAKTKNLFLRDKKGRRHFLVTVRHDIAVDLDALGATLGVGGVGFASAERLQKHLGIKPGSVSLLALVNDEALAVEFVIDRALWEADAVHAHPLVNTATMVDRPRRSRALPRGDTSCAARRRRAGREGSIRPVRAALIICAGQSNVVSGFVERTAKTREEIMKRIGWRMLAVVTAAMIAVAVPNIGVAQQKKLVLWTHWDQNPDFNKWYAEKGKEFAKKSGYEVEVVTVPYQGYEAKYLAAFMAKSGAPDIFMGMTHQWCGQYDFCDKMPDDLAKMYEQNLPKYMVRRRQVEGRALRHTDRARQLPADVHQRRHVQEGRAQSGRSAEEVRRLARGHEEADDSRPQGRRPDAGGLRDPQQGRAGRHHGQVPAVRARLGRAHAEPGPRQGTGYANSPEMVAALTFFGDLVNKDKVASLAFGNPEDAFGQKRAAVIFRESWFFGWLKKNAPDVNFKVYALPCEKTCPGAGALFPWTDLVYKNSPNKQVAWEFMRFISNAKDDMDHHQLQGILPVWTANLETDYVKPRPDYQSTKAMLAQPVPPTYFHPKSNELATAFGEAVVGVLFGKGQPKPLLDEAAAKMDRILKD